MSQELSTSRRPFAWQVPPNKHYVALGHVATNSEDQPPLDCVRCVPRRWVVPSKFTPEMVWDDSGSGGRPGSIWTINEYGFIGVVQGHDPPTFPRFVLRWVAVTTNTTSNSKLHYIPNTKILVL